ncbi:MAG: HtaA domain-containing protein [Micrococcales bacterium]|nr:HtaA domain-containing protein [Micrococcales bacterium]
MHRGTRTRAWRVVTSAVVALVVGAGTTLAAGAAGAAEPDDAGAGAPSCVGVAGATFTWGVKESFRTYITGPIAQGTVTPADVTGTGPWTWSGGTGEIGEDGLADASWGSGSVRFEGHDGALDLTFSAPEVTVTGATTATLTTTVDPGTAESSRVELATLDLAGGTSSTDATQVAWSGVPATLTEAGAVAFAGFYGAGTALDPVAFTLPAGAALDGCGTPPVDPEPEPEPEPEPATPTLRVSQTEGLDPDGATITVTGEGYDTSALGTHPPVLNQPAGVYAQIGWLAESWRPSEGAPSSARSNAYTRWVQGVNDTPPYLRWTVQPDGTADFTWTVEVDRATLEDKRLEGGTLAVFTVGASVAQAANEQSVAIAFAGTGGGDTGGGDTGGGDTGGGDTGGGDTGGGDTGGGTPAPSCVAVSDGTLDWGVRESFRTYITGPVAGGSVSATGVTGTGPWTWSAGTGQVDEHGLATAAWSGGVRFVGHGGELDLTFASPEVRVTGADTAELRVTVTTPEGSQRVRLATLDLAAGTAGSDASRLAWTGVPATLTAAGSEAFAGFYPAGAALDPVSFTLPLGAATSCGTPGVPTTPTVPVTPVTPTVPATPVREVQGLSAAGSVVAGGSVTVTANGFGAGEAGIRLELHSDPVLLAGGLVADAAGSVTVTATIPASTPAGPHTLVLVGAGQTLEFPITVEAAAPVCVARAVSGATLTWGVRESFRSYVTGPIAQGSVTADGVSGTGPWTWSGGTGRYNADAGLGAASWSGGVHFTGHGGQLDLTFSDPQVRLTGATSATLTLTVAGPSGSSRVAVATLDLGAGTASRGATQVAWSGVPATLTAAGAGVFEGFYQAGEALDPVAFTLPLGAEVECDATSGSLATTGAEPGDAVGYAVALLLFGGLLTAAVHRGRRRAHGLTA